MSDPKLSLLDTNVISDMMRNPAGVAAQRAVSIAANEQNSKVSTSVVVLTCGRSVNGLGPRLARMTRTSAHRPWPWVPR